MLMAVHKPIVPRQAGLLLTELRSLIESARQRVAQTANATQTMLYWRVGLRVQREILKNQRAGYGELIVSTLSTQLVAEYGQAFGVRSLRRMVQFAEVFPNEQIVAKLSEEMSWSHFIEICRSNSRWNVSSTQNCAALNAGRCEPCASV